MLHRHGFIVIMPSTRTLMNLLDLIKADNRQPQTRSSYFYIRSTTQEAQPNSSLSSVAAHVHRALFEHSTHVIRNCIVMFHVYKCISYTFGAINCKPRVKHSHPTMSWIPANIAHRAHQSRLLCSVATRMRWVLLQQSTFCSQVNSESLTLHSIRDLSLWKKYIQITCYISCTLRGNGVKLPPNPMLGSLTNPYKP